jgi:O-antigen ligase
MALRGRPTDEGGTEHKAQMSFSQLTRRSAIYSLALMFGAFPMSVALANSLMFLSVVLGLLSLNGADVRDFLSRSWRNPVVRPALALVTLIVVASFWSPASWAEIAGYFKKYAKFLALPMFVYLLARREDRVHCWRAFGLAMLFTLISTWLNVWFKVPWSRTVNQGFGVDHTVFKDHISQGIMMAFFVCLCAHWAVKATSRVQATLCWLVAALGGISILFLSQGRTGYLSLMASAVVFALVALGGRLKALLGTVTVAAMLLVMVYAVSPQFQQRTDLALKEARTSSLKSVTSVGARVEVWRFMASKSTRTTVFGEGTASYPVLAQSYFKDPEFCAVVCPHPHNQFLLFYFELGVVGLALMFWFMLSIVRQAFEYRSTHRALMLAFVVIMVISNMTHSSLWLSTESHFFIMVTALLMASASRPGVRPPPAPATPA